MSRPARPAATEPCGLLARSAALAAAGCGLAHVVLVVAAPGGWTAVVHVAMTVACLPCAVHLWRRPGMAAWAAHAVVSAAMLLAHPLATAVGGHAHHSGPGAAAWAGTAVPILAGGALLLGAFRFWLGYDVPVQTAVASASGRRVPQA